MLLTATADAVSQCVASVVRITTYQLGVNLRIKAAWLTGFGSVSHVQPLFSSFRLLVYLTLEHTPSYGRGLTGYATMQGQRIPLARYDGRTQTLFLVRTNCPA